MHYLDNSATTVVCDTACEKALYMMKNCFGNPSSMHSLGFSAEKELRHSRDIMLSSVSTDGNIFFTSGGTESNNIAILGAVSQNTRYGKKIVTSAIEHPSVLNTMKHLEEKGYEIIYLKPNKNGEIEKKDIYTSVTKDTILVSLMSINNETGYRLPLDCVATAIKRAESPAFFHCDNVQGFMKDIINPKKLGIDLMSISGHKVHAPKGVGALYVAKGKRIKPLMFGGGQENSMRVGTENMAGICAFAQAVKSYKKNPEIKELNRFLREELSQFSQIEINSPDNASPYILNFSLGKIKGETMLHFLAEREIFVSTGSACSGSKASHVLQNMGLEKEKIETSLRISFSNDNNKEDIIALIKALKEGFKNLAHN